jgi:hypothetical protein
VLHYNGLSANTVSGTIVEFEEKFTDYEFLLEKRVDVLHFKDYPSGINWFQAWTLVSQGGMAAGLKGNERLDLDSNTFLNMAAAIVATLMISCMRKRWLGMEHKRPPSKDLIENFKSFLGITNGVESDETLIEMIFGSWERFNTWNVAMQSLIDYEFEEN